MQFLITGCGRSGTKYISKCLAKAGLDVGHERMGEDGAVSSLWCAEVGPYPRYHEQGPRPEFDLILHQIRHPLDVIASLTTSLPESWVFNCRYIPCEVNDPILKRCAYYWYFWNGLAEKQSLYSYCVENIEREWDIILALLHKDGGPLPSVSKDTNSRSYDPVTWGEIESDVGPFINEIYNMACRYGYSERLP